MRPWILASIVIVSGPGCAAKAVDVMQPPRGVPASRAPIAAEAGQVLSARWDDTGQHPDTMAASGPVTVTCLEATSDTANPQPPPACNITGPGSPGTRVEKGRSIGTTGAGTVTLNCEGQGNVLTCRASTQ